MASGHPNNVLLFRLAVSNGFERIAKSVRHSAELCAGNLKDYTDEFDQRQLTKAEFHVRCRNRSYAYLAFALRLLDYSFHETEEQFLKILTILQENPGRARKLHKAMIKELYEGMNADFEDILCEGSLELALAKVGKLSENADSSVLENAWRPPGDVALHLRSLDAERILKETGSLEKRVTELEAENEKLTRKIAEKRSTLAAAHETAARSLKQSPMAVQSLQLRIEQLEKCLKLLQKDWENR